MHNNFKNQFNFNTFQIYFGASQVVLVVKSLPVNAGDIRDAGLTPGSKIPRREISSLAWRISWAEEPGRLQSMGSQRVRYN